MVKNAFSSLKHTDIYRAISMDRLHVNAGGNWDDHLWTASLKPYIEALSSDLRKRVDTQ